MWLPPSEWINSGDLVLELELLTNTDIEEAGEDYGEEDLDSVVIMLILCQMNKVHVKLYKLLLLNKGYSFLFGTLGLS